MGLIQPDIPRKESALAAIYYFGVSGVLYLFWQPKSPYLRHHFRQSLAIFSLLFVTFPLLFLAILLISYAMVHHRDFFEAQHLEPLILTWLRRVILCWSVFWFFGLGLALLRSERDMPIIGTMMKSRWVLGTASALFLLKFGLVLCAGFLAIMGGEIAGASSENARMAVLYDDVNRYPKWIFQLGFYPLLHAGEKRWGEGTVTLEKISKSNIEKATANAQFIFLATHGQAQGILMDGKYLKPSDLRKFPPRAKRQLQFVYLAGCDSGAQREAWEAYFAPAKVVTFDRLSPIVEHIWWIWTQGPSIIRALEEPPPSTPLGSGKKKRKRADKVAPAAASTIGENQIQNAK